MGDEKGTGRKRETKIGKRTKEREKRKESVSQL